MRLDNIQACVFDAYGTLFDVNAAASHCQARLGTQWQTMADIWRSKQLQYTWLRSLMGRYVDFWQITGDALDFALQSIAVDDQALRADLMDLYLKLDAYPEVPAVLRALKQQGKKTAILSNGTPAMLQAAVDNAGIADDLDAILSVDALRIYKPDPQVYQLAVDQLAVTPSQIAFQSSNAWDAHGAASFGFQVIWINRFAQAEERLPEQPAAVLSSLHDFPQLLVG